MKKSQLISTLTYTAIASAQLSFAETTITIGTVNNGDMIRMQGLSAEFENRHPDIKLEWVVLEENVLRQKLTNDIATKGGQFDVMTIGMYEAPMWGKKGWLNELSDLPEAYDLIDIFPAIRDGLSNDGKLYGLPFYGESSVTYYRTDQFDQAGLEMPEQPTWTQVKEFAMKLHNPEKEQYGICLRGKAGWGENMALITTMSNAFGARWFNPEWKPEFDGGAWRETLSFYVDLLGKYGPPGASGNGFNENLALFNTGKCAMWVDASVAGSFVTDPTQSKVHENVGFALAPMEVTSNGAGWLWTWALAIPSSSDAVSAARTFVTWATSKEYVALVASTSGIKNVPPGTRASTYDEKYLTEAPFAEITLQAMGNADPINSTKNPKPYVGVQFVGIPEFQAIGTQVGKLFSGALAGTSNVDNALKAAQEYTSRQMNRAGYF